MARYPGGAAIRRWGHCLYKGMETVVFNDAWLVGAKGPKMCLENIPHFVTPTA